jgi:hypothetical protein
VAPTAKGYGEGIVQTTNADKAAAKVEVVRKSAPRKGVGVRVPPSAPALNFLSKINARRSLHLGRSYLIFVSPSRTEFQTGGNARTTGATSAVMVDSSASKAVSDQRRRDRLPTGGPSRLPQERLLALGVPWAMGPAAYHTAGDSP